MNEFVNISHSLVLLGIIAYKLSQRVHNFTITLLRFYVCLFVFLVKI